MGMSTRKTYTPEYRLEAALLVIDTDRTVVAVARETGINLTGNVTYFQGHGGTPAVTMPTFETMAVLGTEVNSGVTDSGCATR